MIPYELDPSLHAAAPLPEQLGDGFAPPPSDATAVPLTPDEALALLDAQPSEF